MSAARFPSRQSDLQDQAVRATQSTALNIAEGWGRTGNARTNHFRVALGSAAEACAVLDLVEIPGGSERQEELRRIGAMLRKLGA